MPKLANKSQLVNISKGINYLFAVFVVLLASLLVFQTTTCQGLVAVGMTGKSPIIDINKVSRGYTLITPISQRSDTGGKNVVYFTDLYGQPVHKWTTEFAAFYSVLDNQANLVTAIISPFDPKNYPTGARTGLIQKLNWKGEKIWEYKNDLIHHDFAVLPNGNVAVTVWEKIPKTISDKIKGGIPNSEFKGEIWGDKIVEVDKDGKEVWSWSAHQNMDTNIDVFQPSTARSTWTLLNGVTYLPKDPIEGKEAYLISLRGVNTVAIVRKEDGKIIWRSPKGAFSGQHDATLLPNGNILAFNNNIDAAFSNPPTGSNITEINPKTNEIVWQLDNGAKGIENKRFYSYLVGGAQRLPNGNTFVADGLQGHMFEVTADKKLVWDLVNPFTTPETGIFPNNAMFKAKKYTNDQVDWPTKLKSDLPKSAEVCETLDRFI